MFLEGKNNTFCIDTGIIYDQFQITQIEKEGQFAKMEYGEEGTGHIIQLKNEKCLITFILESSGYYTCVQIKQ